MFNLKEKFQFLEDGIDFPFYNDKPKLSTGEWGVLAIAVIIFSILCFTKGIPKPLHSGQAPQGELNENILVSNCGIE